MATPLSADKMVAALKAEGLKPKEYPGWRTHNRAGHGAWGPMNGIIIHHTAGRDSLKTVYNGRSDLPGPLAHAHLAKDGTLTLTGNGRANHAGLGDADVLHAVTVEASVYPKPNENNVDGNAHFYGIEIENLGNGKDPYPDVQYKAAVKWAAAICRAHGWSAKSVIGHKEWTNQKIDPSFSMTKFRSDVAAQLKPAAKTTTPTTKTTTEVDSVTVSPGQWYLSLGYVAGVDLAPGAWTNVSFDTEYDDTGGFHVAGSADISSQAGVYSGVVYVRFSNLTAGAEAQARLVEVDGTGAVVKTHPIVEGVGTAGSTFFELSTWGKMASGRKLRLQVSHYDVDNAHLDSVDLRQIWYV